jgi:hypothetical protein
MIYSDVRKSYIAEHIGVVATCAGIDRGGEQEQ